MQAAALGLGERLAHDLRGDAHDLDVHLQRGDALARAGDLEVHVAVVVLGAGDVGEDGVLVAFLHEAHRDAGDRTLERDARLHQRERGAADGGHRRRSVRLEDVGDDAQRVGRLLLAGRTASMARHASAPWPISRRPTPLMRPTSPTENGGKL